MRMPQTAFIFSALFSFLIGKTLIAQDSNAVKLTRKISIIFPLTPVKQEMGSAATMYTLRLADSTANFMGLVSNLQVQAGLDSATLAEAVKQPEFWDQASEGFVGQMGPDAKLIKKEMKKLGTYDVMELTLERPAAEGGGNNTLTIYIIIDDVYSINIGHTNRKGKADVKMKETFLQSLKIEQ